MSTNKFKSPWWLRNCHLQTIFPSLFPRRLNIQPTRERIHLPDDDFVDLDWIGNNHEDIVLVLHGIAGSIASPYVRGILGAINCKGWTGVLLNFRGCSGEPNCLPRSYHAGETEDLSYIINELKHRFPRSKLSVVGYSLGGNVLLKWLGENPTQESIACAVAVSVPFDLFDAVDRLQRGFSRFYQWRLLQDLKASIIEKASRVALHIQPDEVKNLKSFREFDQAITAPLHGFKGADHYYSTASSKRFLKKIKIPTLIIHAKDDPFMSANAIPKIDEISDSVSLEVTESGGHVGFIGGNNPIKPKFWLEERIIEYLQEYLHKP